ncbi:hypothetical protein ABGB07_40790 [Micromonosporaceae bacterium B7E4]
MRRLVQQSRQSLVPVAEHVAVDRHIAGERAVEAVRAPQPTSVGRAPHPFRGLPHAGDMGFAVGSTPHSDGVLVEWGQLGA